MKKLFIFLLKKFIIKIYKIMTANMDYEMTNGEDYR